MKINKQEKAMFKKILLFIQIQIFKSISKIRFNDSSGTDDEDDLRKCGTKTNNYKRQLIFWI